VCHRSFMKGVSNSNDLKPHCRREVLLVNVRRDTVQQGGMLRIRSESTFMSQYRCSWWTKEWAQSFVLAVPTERRSGSTSTPEHSCVFHLPRSRLRHGYYHLSRNRPSYRNCAVQPLQRCPGDGCIADCAPKMRHVLWPWQTKK
jgi:hypothetical protein